MCGVLNMSENDDPVTDKLCIARMDGLRQEIKALKTTIIACGATMTTIVVVVQFILTLWKG